MFIMRLRSTGVHTPYVAEFGLLWSSAFWPELDPPSCSVGCVNSVLPHARFSLPVEKMSSSMQGRSRPSLGSASLVILSVCGLRGRLVLCPELGLVKGSASRPRSWARRWWKLVPSCCARRLSLSIKKLSSAIEGNHELDELLVAIP
ncbi:hypothetical protein Dimus_029592 [Dionaea muscipula]